MALETERLILRPFEADDRRELTKLCAEESFWWFGLRRPMTPDESAAFLERVMATYDGPDPGPHAAVERHTGALTGYVGLSVPHFLPELLPAVEVGWRLGEEYRGRGYATEAAAATIRWGFTDLGLARIVSIFEPDNIASGRVMDHLGFGPGTAASHPTQGVVLLVRSLTKEEWRIGPAG